jgi:hypothetical protein
VSARPPVPTPVIVVTGIAVAVTAVVALRGLRGAANDVMRLGNWVVRTCTGTPRIRVQRAALDFGAVRNAAPVTMNLTVTNIGNANLLLRPLVLAGRHPGDFTVLDAMPDQLQPAASAVIRVRFTPALATPRDALLAVLSSDPDQPQVDIVLRGRGVLLNAHLYLDEDRDGLIDPAPANCPVWEAGVGRRGAILLPKTRTPWRDDGSEDPAGDVGERLHLRLRWDGLVPAALDQWQVLLEIDRREAILLYPSRANNAVPLVIPGNGVLDLSALMNGRAELDLYAQAAGYPDGGGAHSMQPQAAYSATEAHWRVLLTFRVTDGVETVRQRSQLRIAPWIMAADLEPTARLCFRSPQQSIDTRRTVRYELQMLDALTAALPASCASFMATVTDSPKDVGNSKNFARDVMKSGFVSAPHYDGITLLSGLDAEAVVLGMPLQLTQAAGIGNVGMFKAHTFNSSHTNGGNLMVAPPRDDTPLGTIVIGHAGQARCGLRPFLLAQRAQPVLELDSSWLRVGHVDEYISFVPDIAAGAGGHKILLASARLAHILTYACAARPDGDVGECITKAARLNGEVFSARQALASSMQLEAEFGPVVDAATSAPVKAAYTPAPPVPAGTNGRVVLWTPEPELACIAYGASEVLANGGMTASAQTTQRALDADRGRLLAGLNATEDEFIDLPVIFQPEGADTFAGFTADSVNMVVINNAEGCRCIVPKPFGPVMSGQYLFEVYIAQRLTALGLEVHFINDWHDFHRNDGEIHCGTNQLPVSRQVRWWEREGVYV